MNFCGCWWKEQEISLRNVTDNSTQIWSKIYLREHVCTETCLGKRKVQFLGSHRIDDVKVE